MNLRGVHCTPPRKNVDVPPATLNVSRPQLEEVRLLSPSGIETPYVIEWPAFSILTNSIALPPQASLVNQTTVLTLATGTAEPIEAVILESLLSFFAHALGP